MQYICHPKIETNGTSCLKGGEAVIKGRLTCWWEGFSMIQHKLFTLPSPQGMPLYCTAKSPSLLSLIPLMIIGRHHPDILLFSQFLTVRSYLVNTIRKKGCFFRSFAKKKNWKKKISSLLDLCAMRKHSMMKEWVRCPKNLREIHDGRTDLFF